MTSRVLPLSRGRLVLGPRPSRAGWHMAGLSPAASRSRFLGLAAASLLVRATGAWWLRPGAPVEESWPHLSIDELASRVAAQIGTFQPIGAGLPRQADRRRLLLLGRAHGTLVVAKFDSSPDRLRPEANALELLARTPLPLTGTPFLLGLAEQTEGGESIGLLVQTMVTERLHRPRYRMVPNLAAHIATSLADLPRGDVAGHWVPGHGDLAPWNLRDTGRGSALVDWETAGWQPPGADEAYFVASSAAVRNRRVATPLDDEVRAFWAERLSGEIDPADVRFRHRLAVNLGIDAAPHPHEGVGR